MPRDAKSSENLPESSPINPKTSQTLAPGTTVGEAKELWSEVLFYLALFFGLLHFAGLFMQGFIFKMKRGFGGASHPT